MADERAPLNDDEPFWDISGPRKYLHFPSPVPDHWRAALTFGRFPDYQTVVGWGPTEAAAREEAMRQAAAATAVCAGGIDPGFDECPKCGATMDDDCRGAAPSQERP